ncbi:hypothetical protein [Bacillus coahuilensis]|uniref:hypothetical protein n=1 Tax=Bacillus coahuilensis TaxID=408580 RepID=UPI0001850B9F|nr:hypothetical protein [Bacillus coahuilensis]
MFKKSGKNPVINQLLLELRSLEKDLTILKGKNDKYIHHLEEKEMLEESIRYSETEYGDQQHLLNRLQELQRIRPLYMEKKKLSYEQNQLEGCKNFPFSGASRLEKLLIECEELTISFQHLEKKREELETSPIIGLSSKQAALIHQYLNEETPLKQLNNKIEQLKIEIENEMKDVTSLQDHLGMQNVTYDEVEK